MNATLLTAARQFVAGQTALDISPLGNGLINDTFLVKASSGDFVLQRINPRVFPHPQGVMDNLLQLGRHVRQKPADAVHLQIPAVIETRDGHPCYRDESDQIWRALQLISPAESREQLNNADDAAQVGFALAHFHHLCSDLPPAQLHDTLPGFHVTPAYFQDYRTLIAQPLTVAVDSQFCRCRDFIEARGDDINILEQAAQRGELRQRVIHGDPKLNNFLFRPGSHRVVSLIDLDTVKPGLVHYDIGDCLRSCCHQRESNRFDLNFCRHILHSYLREAGSFFSEADYRYLYPAVWLIPFELGLRFFSDYLAGNRYFKVTDPRHNLRRALAQFALCESIAGQQVAIEDMITGLRNHDLRK